jgi:predicted dehydrogenase
VTIKTAVVGLGYWGPKIARNVLLNPKFELVALVEPIQEKAISALANLGNPNCRIFNSAQNLIQNIRAKDLNIDLAIIAVPPRLHLQIATLFIENGINVLIEKPVGANYKESEEIIELSLARGTKVFADFTFLHTAEFDYIKKQILSNRIGEKLLYFHSNRFNLGLIQNDVSVIEDLMVHDVAILLALTEHLEIEFDNIIASGIKTFPSKHISTGFAQLLGDGFVASFAASWNSPVKQREVHICGEKGMMVWNDVNVSEKLKLYSSEVRTVNPNKLELSQISYHMGDAIVPSIVGKEALSVLLNHLANRLNNNQEDDKHFILRVWKVLHEIIKQSNYNSSIGGK